MLYLELEGVKIGFVFTGAYYMFEKTIPKLKELIENKAIIIPIMSCKNGLHEIQGYISEIEAITSNKVIHKVQDIEPIWKKNMTDIMVVAPCTRKYYIKTRIRYCRYRSNNSGTISFKKWKAYRNCNIDTKWLRL